MAAKKKKISKKKKVTKAVAKRGTVAVGAPSEKWADRFGEVLNDQPAASSTIEGWTWMRTRGAEFSLLDMKLGTEIDIVALAATQENLYYEDDFDPNQMSAPTCYAIDKTGKANEMAPPADLETKLADRCEDCWANAFGSGSGRGKACKNYVRVVAVSPDRLQDEGFRLRLPPTSIQLWSAYAQKLQKGFKRPVSFVKTHLEIERGESGVGFKVTPSLVDFINDDDELEIIDAQLEVAKIEAFRPPAMTAGDDDKPAPRKRKKKKASKKKARRKK